MRRSLLTPISGLRRVASALAIVTTASVLYAAPALAQPERDRAATLFKQGRAAMVKGDAASACPMFAESQRLDPAPGTLLNLALCEEARGMLAGAVEHFTVVAAQVPDGDERRGFAIEHANALRPRIARLRIDLAPAPPGTIVERDGAPIPPSDLGTPVFVDPGMHKVTVSTPGRPPSSYSVSLGAGETRSLPVEASAAPTRVVAEPAPQPGWSTGKKAGVALLTVGGVLLVGGVVTGAMALADKSTVDKDCGPSACTTQAGIDAAAQGRVVSIMSTVGFIGGLAGLGGGAVLVIVSPRHPASASIAPRFSSTGGGLACIGSF